MGAIFDAYEEFKRTNDEYNKAGVLNLSQQFPTAPTNADGTLSDTPDGTPNLAHVMIAVGFSSNAANGMDVFFTQLDNLMRAQAVTALDGTKYCTDPRNGK